MFAFQPGQEPAAEVRRVAVGEIDSALVHLQTGTPGEEAVHEVRKHMKKLRGLLRLVREPLGELYVQENARYRGVARKLAGLRDADVMLRTFGRVCENSRGMSKAPRQRIADRLGQHRDMLRSAQGEMRENVLLARLALESGRGALEHWSLPETEAGLFRPGLQRMYRQSRQQFYLAMSQPSDGHMHDWRKPVKYHWYHVRLLAQLDPVQLQPREEKLRRLADGIGQLHDLSVLQQYLTGLPRDVLSAREKLDVFEAIALLQNRDRELSWSLGEELFMQQPGEWTRACLEGCARHV